MIVSRLEAWCGECHHKVHFGRACQVVEVQDHIQHRCQHLEPSNREMAKPQQYTYEETNTNGTGII